MPTLKGKWYFKEVIDNIPDLGEVEFHFINSGNTFEVISFGASSLGFGDLRGSGDIVYEKETHWNGTDYWRPIEIIDAQEVSEEFYNWFTKNAVNLQPTGTWRFNKTLKLPAVTQDTGYDNLSVSDSKTFCTVHDTDQGQIDAMRLSINVNTSTNGGITSLGCQDTEGENCYMWILDGDNEFWVSEDARLITFNDQLVLLSPDFALWFYENAHSMELKLYSECYIAEASDVLKSYTKATGYTIKDFAGAIDSLGSKYIEGDFEKY